MEKLKGASFLFHSSHQIGLYAAEARITFRFPLLKGLLSFQWLHHKVMLTKNRYFLVQ